MSTSVDDFLPYAINIDEPTLQSNLKEINESPESKAKCLEILRTELKKMQDIEPCLEENFLLRFLRVSKFNTTTALQRLLKYYKQQEKLLNSLNKVSLSLNKAHSFKPSWLVSPYRMKNNSLLLFHFSGKVDYSKITFAERFYLDVLAINGAFENTPVNQITGATAIFDYDGFNLRSFQAHTPGWVLLFTETFMNAFPARVKVVHIVNAPSAFTTVFRIVYPFFPKKIQERIFVHPNDGWKSLHEEIPLEILPEKYGGKLKLESCIDLLENITELDSQFLRIFNYGYIKTKANRQSFRLIH